MKFLKPTLVILILLALTYTVNASKVSLGPLTISKSTVASSIEKNSSTSAKISFNNANEVSSIQQNTPANLPLHGDLLFAFTAIATLGGYLIIKK